MNSYSCQIKDSDIAKIKNDLQQRGFLFRDLPYGFFHASSKSLKINISVYHSLKCLIQGKGTEEFVRFYLEPEVLKSFGLDYGHLEFEDKIGMDESGKGDYFGPLVVAAVYVEKNNYDFLKKAGVADSKKISDKRIPVIAKIIREKCLYKTLLITPEKYNKLYESFKNLNKLLSWAHSTCLKNILPGCKTNNVLVDKFAHNGVLESYINKLRLQITLTQRIKAESDIAVAAASILARSVFLTQLEKLEKEYDMPIPKGGGIESVKTGMMIVNKFGKETLLKMAKLHFKNTDKIITEQPLTNSK